MNKPVSYKIIRSRRRSIALQVNSDTTLIVRAPVFASSRYIEKIVTEKQRWITQKQNEMLRKSKQSSKKEFIDGEDFLFLGKKYKLKFIPDQKENIIFNEDLLIAEDKKNYTKKIIENWYKKQATEKINQRVIFYADNHGFKHNAIKLSNACTSWGSCSPDNTLRFSWRLIMAPLNVVDYVVVHELSHLRHRNHSADFWATVGLILPNYKTERKWLKQNGYLLKI